MGTRAGTRVALTSLLIAGCSLKRRPRLAQPRRTRGSLATCCSAPNPLKRGDECREGGDYHGNREQQDHRVGIPLGTHEQLHSDGLVAEQPSN